MPITYTVLPERAAILVKAAGMVDRRQFIEYLSALIDDPAVPADHVNLLDVRRVTDLRLSEEDVAAISEFTAAHPDRIIAKKLAIVASGRRSSDLARHYEQLAARFKETTIVFFNIDVACEWLGLPPGL